MTINERKKIKKSGRTILAHCLKRLNTFWEGCRSKTVSPKFCGAGEMTQ